MVIINMVINRAVGLLAILLLTACGGGGGSSSSSNQQTGYDPTLKEQTITVADLQSVKEIAAGNTVTIEADTTLLASSPDLVVKGNLVIN